MGHRYFGKCLHEFTGRIAVNDFNRQVHRKRSLRQGRVGQFNGLAAADKMTDHFCTESTLLQSLLKVPRIFLGDQFASACSDQSGDRFNEFCSLWVVINHLGRPDRGNKTEDHEIEAGRDIHP